jgi:L-alanine-DL-glutamate epimerase-like enolase superfamily enzyme
MAPRLRDLGVAWYEEPLLASEPEPYVREMRYLKDRVGIPLSGGQNLHTRFEFKELVTERAVDIVQPDCARCGGITELRRIAELAGTWGLACMPHIGCGAGYDVRVVATLHVLAAISNGMMLCYPAYDTPLRTELLVEPPRVVDGRTAPPQGPGLGIALDPEAVERYRAERS